ncbi:fibronectin type III domain-containing protein [Cohnella herbarum]|uniref:Fibronectin type III domain-containing protein n=1 Tax=Cohnella herbarum TaxID=2728023 RepID=A0A7Z2VR32_9BACL|nr:fibronectin type III domain-containing protein [Cohnella herbarum]QJD87599.1 fibronectin type III domain-containing protein [Cohnella herbarum]
MKKKISFTILALLVVITTLFSSVSFADSAIVGQQLLQPESGWKRIDDSDPSIKYSSNRVSGGTTAAFNNTYNLLFQNESVEFKFKGTKLRIINMYYYANQSDNVKVLIDGVEYTYSCAGDGREVWQVLAFEKLNLTDTIHTVKITNAHENSNYHIYMDAIDIDDSGYVLDPDSNPTTEIPDSISNLSAQSHNSNIKLSWNAVTGAISYIVKRSTTVGGPYTDIASNVTGNIYSDTTAVVGTTYYYVVVAVNSNGQSGLSNEVSATLQPISNGKAILTITMTNGSIKEYDLSQQQLDSFITWVDEKDNGNGPEKYKFVKTWNKGPFKARNEYVIFDKILTFSVDEYDVVTQ